MVQSLFFAQQINHTLIEQLKISKNTKVNLIEQNNKIVISNNNNLENSETKDKSEKYEEIKEPKNTFILSIILKILIAQLNVKSQYLKLEMICCFSK